MSTKLLAIVRENRAAVEKELELLNKEREVRQAEADRLVADAEKESRDLDSKEAARFREINAQLRDIDVRSDNDSDENPGAKQRLDALVERENELRSFHEADERARKNAESWSSRAESTSDVSASAKVKREDRTYSQEADRRGVSFLRDVYLRFKDHDPGATDRLDRHHRESRFHEMAGYESRDVGTAAFTGLVVPQYLTDLVAPLQRAMAPVVGIANRHPLPADGMTVNISRITTGTGVGAQSGEFTAATEQNADDTLLTINVRTYSGQQDVSRQAIERGTGIDSLLIEDLTRAYWTTLDNALLNGDGTNGTHLGIRSTSSIVGVTYTDSTPTFAEAYPKFADLISQVQSGVFMGVSHFVMHPRRWWWLAKELGTSSPLLTVPSAGDNQVGSVGGTDYAGMNRSILGVPVVLDGNIPTGLGAGTNEDVILGVTASELHLWHDPQAPLFIRAEQPAAAELAVKFVVYGYSAFTAGRYPGAHGTVGGTGLATPSF